MRKKIFTIFASLLIASLTLSSCSGEGNAAISNVDAQTFLAQAQSSAIKIIDVRSAGEFASGHLAGALNIDVESGGFDSGIANLDKNAAYGLYCRSGRRSSIAAKRMAEVGFTNIINFNQGGYEDLAALGAPTE